MAGTPVLGFQLMGSNQSQKHVTFNNALLELDILIQLTILDRDLSSPPGSPSPGDRYIVASGASGLWSGQEGKIAAWINSIWKFFDPLEGWVATVLDENILVRFDNSSWIEQPIASGQWNSFTRARVLTEELSLIGSSVNSNIQIPDRSIVLAVSTRTVVSITGATSYDCGINGELDKFGGSLGITASANNVGVIGPQAFYSDEDIILTANGGDFTGGSVKISIHILEFGVPDA